VVFGCDEVWVECNGDISLDNRDSEFEYSSSSEFFVFNGSEGYFESGCLEDCFIEPEEPLVVGNVGDVLFDIEDLVDPELSDLSIWLGRAVVIRTEDKLTGDSDGVWTVVAFIAVIFFDDLDPVGFKSVGVETGCNSGDGAEVIGCLGLVS